MRRVEHCESCGYALYAYPSERGPFYCETVRCEQGQDAHDALTARMNTEKRSGHRRQTEDQSASESNTYQEASAMEQDTATRNPAARDVERALSVVIGKAARARWENTDHLATVAGVSPTTMRRRLDTGSGWTLRQLSRVADHLGRKTSDLMADADELARAWQAQGGGR